MTRHILLARSRPNECCKRGRTWYLWQGRRKLYGFEQALYNIPHYQACSLQSFTVYNLCIWFGWRGRKAAKDEPLGSFYNTTLPSLFFKYATSDLAKSYATLAHFSWFMLTYYNHPVLIGFHKTWNVEANRILLTILNRKAADVSRWVLSFLRP